ncbi:MAG: hypothetical protein K0Q43_4657 [Ramlibacter sp.]|jgi:hypothetical protein|nr:hypothetical protein [Ramlibacter sp.]
MAAVSVSDKKMPQSVVWAATTLLKKGWSAAGTDYIVSASELGTANLSQHHFSTLLTTGLPWMPGMLGVVRTYAVDKTTGDIGFKLNYDLAP